MGSGSQPSLGQGGLARRPFRPIPFPSTLRQAQCKLAQGKLQAQDKLQAKVSVNSSQRFEVIFYPVPVQNEMHHHQGDK